MPALVKVDSALASKAIVRELRELAQHSVPENTRRTYRTAYRRFQEWCKAHGLEPMPASEKVLCLYVGHLSTEGKRLSTVQHALSAIHSEHGERGLRSERDAFRVKKLLRGLGRKQADQPKKQKRAITKELLADLVSVQPKSLLGVRDRTVLLIGFSSACRRSELAALTVEDLEWRPGGVLLRIKRSKTDQLGQGVQIGVRENLPEHRFMCPVRSLRYWLKLSNIRSGPIFRNVLPNDVVGPPMRPEEICGVVKRACKLAKMNADVYGAHSLRAGYVTSSAEAGKPLHVIMETTRHKSSEVCQMYIRRTELLRGGKGEGLLNFGARDGREKPLGT